MTPFLGELLSLPSWWATIAGALCVVHEILSLVIPTQYAKFVEWTNPQKQWKTRLKGESDDITPEAVSVKERLLLFSGGGSLIRTGAPYGLSV